MCTNPKIAYRFRRATHDYGNPVEITFRQPPLNDWQKYDQIALPCGKCVSCQIAKSRDWANRCILEMEDHSHTTFLTLTYDDAHLPRTWDINKATGECTPVATLVPRDLQLFLKKLRFHADNHIRFFACGEYGSRTFRPHYHLIIFGLHCQDAEPQSRSEIGNQYYTSDFISRLWTDQYGDPLGYHILAPATWKTCAYTARYILKKQTDQNSRQWYKDHGLEPPFMRCSRSPGIGAHYLERHPDCMQFTQISSGDIDGARSFCPPAYFKRKFKEQDPVSADWYSIERETFSASQTAAKKLLTDKDIYDILKDDERRVLKILNQLPRGEF